MAKKAELRGIYLQKRTELLPELHETMENEVIEQFFELPEFTDWQVVHIYLPLARMKEINTWKIIEKLWDEDREVVIPGISADRNSLNCYALQTNDEMVTADWGLSEPKEKRPADVNKIDAMILPLLCFDQQGYRVGYGKGYYDRFLPTIRRPIWKIGLGLFDPVLHIEDTANWDIPLDVGITPTGVYRFRSDDNALNN
jgi:5-formyltetrahydrofolate cyclo-ligase